MKATKSARKRQKARERMAALRAALREVSALVETPGSRTESEVDAIREVVAGALGGGP